MCEITHSTINLKKYETKNISHMRKKITYLFKSFYCITCISTFKNTCKDSCKLLMKRFNKENSHYLSITILKYYKTEFKRECKG